MKICFYLFLLAAGNLLIVQHCSGQDLSKILINLHLKNSTLKKALHEIEGLAHVSFTYRTDDVAGHKNISLQEYRIPLPELLDKLFQGTDLKYEQVNTNIIIKKNRDPSLAIQSIDPGEVPPVLSRDTIRGKVVNENHEALPGVTVRIRDQNKGVLTDASGNFQLLVTGRNITLEFSYVGHSSREVDLRKEEITTIVLSTNPDELNEVLVTALGISKESYKLGYAVSTVDGDLLNKARETNVALSLQGRVAGLNVHGVSGGPGGTARMLLRGMPSMNSNGSPLFVINGVPMDNTNRGTAGEWGGSDNGDGIGNINPDDIETMTVLKGQAASALYGARASNGVIMIITKSGKKGNFAVEYNVNALWDKAINNTDFQYVYGQGQNGAKPANITEARNTTRLSWGARLDGSPFTQFDGNTYNYSAYKDNVANFYRTGPSLTNTIALSGGNDRSTFRLSLSNLDNSSVLRNSGLDRKTINLNLTEKITGKLTATVMANYIDESDRNRSQLSDGPGNPNNGFFLATNIDENILRPGYDATGAEIVFSDDNYVTNPWFVVNKFINNTGRKRLIAAVTGKYNFTDWLYAQGRVGYDLENDRIFQVAPTGTNFSYNAVGQSGQLYGLTSLQTSELNLDGLIGVSHHLNEDLSLDATVGVNSRKNNYEYLQINGSQFVIPFLYAPGNVLNFGRNYYFSQAEVHSAFYTLDFNYKDLLLLNTTGRYDTYSTLPNDNRTIFTPSVSGGFIFSKCLNSHVLNYGKLRAAYAQTSGEAIGGPNNNNSGAYQAGVYYGVANSINGTPVGLLNGAAGNVNNLANLPNLFLKPFVLDEMEFGAELKFFKSRLGLDLSYFARQTHQEIQSATLSQASGYSNTVVGTGSTQNKGLELLITGTPMTSGQGSWNVSLNLTSVKNKILQTDAAGTTRILGTDRPNHGSAVTAYVVGQAAPQILVHDYKRDAKGNIVVDASGLPESGDFVSAGGVLPSLYGGLNNEFAIHGFNFSFLLDYNYGNKVLSATKYYTVYRGLDKMTLAGRETGITTGVHEDGGINTTTASAENYYQALANNVQKISVLNGDFIKLRQITLGYTFTERQLRGQPFFRSVQLSLVARNLIAFLKHTDNIDPEATFGSNVQYAGIEGTSLPSTRSFGINLNCGFK
ncbi:MAG TPA: SusC/RagA family TonB-linked outer membrane protein [Puia sp.]|nr:SusC/RagA family TonB-linked outer membrane protein [Puia sp.]